MRRWSLPCSREVVPIDRQVPRQVAGTGRYTNNCPVQQHRSRLRLVAAKHISRPAVNSRFTIVICRLTIHEPGDAHVAQLPVVVYYSLRETSQAEAQRLRIIKQGADDFRHVGRNRLFKELPPKPYHRRNNIRSAHFALCRGGCQSAVVLVEGAEPKRRIAPVCFSPRPRGIVPNMGEEAPVVFGSDRLVAWRDQSIAHVPRMRMAHPSLSTAQAMTACSMQRGTAVKTTPIATP